MLVWCFLALHDNKLNKWEKMFQFVSHFRLATATPTIHLKHTDKKKRCWFAHSSNLTETGKHFKRAEHSELEKKNEYKCVYSLCLRRGPYSAILVVESVTKYVVFKLKRAYECARAIHSDGFEHTRTSHICTVGSQLACGRARFDIFPSRSSSSRDYFNFATIDIAMRLKIRKIRRKKRRRKKKRSVPTVELINLLRIAVTYRPYDWSNAKARFRIVWRYPRRRQLQRSQH